MNGVAWCLEERARSAANKTVAPRINAYVAAVRSAAPTGGLDGDDVGYPGTLAAPDDFRKLVTWSKQKGIDGFKVLALDPDLMRALLDASKKQGLGVAAHLSQMMVARFNAITAAEAGRTTLEHWSGLPESLFDDRTIQDYEAAAVKEATEETNAPDNLMKAYEDAFNEGDKIKDASIIPLSDKDLQALLKEFEKDSQEKLGKLVNILFEMMYLADSRQDFEDISLFLMNSVDYAVLRGDIHVVTDILSRL